MIEQRSIDEVFDRADIVEIAQQLVSGLKKSGASYKAKSPFTSEKSGSFFVVPAKGIYKCFSSGKGGNVVSLVMEIKGLDYPGAIKFIADFYRIELKYTNTKQESEEEQTERETALHLLNQSKKKYVELRKNAPSPLAQGFFAKRGLDEDDLIQWELGFSPDDFKTLTTPFLEKGVFKVAAKIGLVSEKGTRKYDFLVNRITIPIYDRHSKLVGMAGRSLIDENRIAKYLNPKESFIYHKEHVLFGLNHAAESIKREGKVYLLEGYFDVIMSHKHGLENSVASCGTALTSGQIKQLSHLCKHVVILFDGDKAGKKATSRAIPLLLEQGFKVDVCELPMVDGAAIDPDDFFKSGRKKEELENFTQDALRAMIEREAREEDIDLRQDGMTECCQCISRITGELKRQEYLTLVASTFPGANKTIVKKEFERALVEIEKQRNSLSGKQTKEREEGALFNDEKIEEMYNQFNFYEDRNQYWFLNKDGNQWAGSNFTIKPLYHVVDPENDRRIIEVSRFDRKELIDVPSTDLISFGKFRAFLFTKGPFVFFSGITELHYSKIIAYLVDQFKESIPINILGQQPEEFWAYANGIAVDGEFIEVNDMGMVEFEDSYTNPKGQSMVTEKTFFLPTFSKMYAKMRDNDMFENSRKMKYMKSNITLQHYAESMLKIYGKEHGLIGVAFLISSHFRDLYVKNFNFFPLMFCYGEKGSGKSAFSTLLQDFFFLKQDPLMLNSGTSPGFFRRLAQVRNAITFCDEYTDDIDEGKFQALKSAWGGTGREIGTKSTDKRTVIDKVESSLVISGQYLPNRDDFSLNDRSIILEFKKQTGGWDKDKSHAFRELEKEVKRGINSLCADLHQHRPDIKRQIISAFNEMDNELKNKLKGQRHRDRNRNNYAVLLTTMKMLKDQLGWQKWYEELFEVCLDKIVQSNDMISDGEGLSEYWAIVGDLIRKGVVNKEQTLRVREDVNYEEVRDKKGVKHALSFEKSKDLLYISLPNLQGDYSKEYRIRHGKNCINRQTVMSYIEARPYYVGRKKSMRFGDFNTTCFVLDYGLMKEDGIHLLALSDTNEDEAEGSKQNKTQNKSAAANELDGDGTAKMPF
jgi:DNA primase catalytic core